MVYKERLQWGVLLIATTFPLSYSESSPKSLLFELYLHLSPQPQAIESEFPDTP